MSSPNEILVSICCLTYNHAPYIRQCLDGFLMQKTYFKYEVIIHDDCSTDGTTDIVREYAEKYPDVIVPIIQSVNQYQNGNKRIEESYIYPKARGRFFAMCEGDDYWTDPYKLQKQVDFLESHPEYSMCFHRATILKEMENQENYLMCHDIEDREYNPDELFQVWKVPTASIMAKREIMDVTNKGIDRILNGDIVLVLNCAKIGKMRGMSDCMSVYRLQSTGITYNKAFYNHRIMRYPAHYMFIKENYPFLNKAVINQKIAKAYFVRRRIESSKAAYIKDVWQSFRYYPMGIIRLLFGLRYTKL